MQPRRASISTTRTATAPSRATNWTAPSSVVDRTETVKGYEIGKGQFIVVTDDELESVAVERRRTIDIISFIDIEEVDPVY